MSVSFTLTASITFAVSDSLRLKLTYNKSAISCIGQAELDTLDSSCRTRMRVEVSMHPFAVTVRTCQAENVARLIKLYQ